MPPTDDAAPSRPTGRVDTPRTAGEDGRGGDAGASRSGDRTGARSSDPAAGRVVRTPPGPTTAGERVELLDVLRGFALVGILVVNMQLLKSPLGEAELPERFPGAADQ